MNTPEHKTIIIIVLVIFIAGMFSYGFVSVGYDNAYQSGYEFGAIDFYDAIGSEIQNNGFAQIDYGDTTVTCGVLQQEV